jgi:uncharacterized protein YbaP (TraB family)
MRMTRPRTWLALLLVCSLLSGRAGADPPADEIIVNAMRMGPRLWHVQQGGAQLWILGTVSPLPIGVTWRAGEVERLLGSASVVLAAKPLEISLPRVLWILIAQRDLVMIKGGAKLRDVLPPDLYARFAVQRAKYAGRSDKWERYRPIIAAALLEDAALQKNGLSARLDVSLAVRRLARKHHVRVDEVKIPGAPDLLDALKNVAPEAESRCVASIVGTVESGLPLLAQRADAWSSGDLERMQSLPESTEASCGASLSADAGAAGVLAQIHRRWLAALEAQLHGTATSVAVLDVDLLLGPGGLLEALRAEGFAVDAP